MVIKHSNLLFSIILLLISGYSAGQGCSDAGFCTTGALQFRHEVRDSIPGNTLGLSLTAGRGEREVFVLVPQVEWKHSFRDLFDLEVKLPYYWTNGNLGRYSGLGDPIATITRQWKGKKRWNFFTTMGLRLSLTNAAKENKDGRPLPMPYQTGLGTTDLILGAAAQYDGWLFFSGGYQQPVIQYNRNGYLASGFPLESDAYKSYFDSRQLVRKGDILMRVEGQITRKQMTLSGGPLLIYHLGNDLVTGLNGLESSLVGSSGATLNLAAKISWQLKQSKWEFGGGTPLIVRDVRPDGLTRSVVLTLRYERYLRKSIQTKRYH